MIYAHSNPEHFSGLEKIDFAQFSNNIFLWGAGRIGSVVAHVLKQKGIGIIGFVDAKPSFWGKTFCNYNVISPEKFYSLHSSCVVIITTQLRKEIMPELISHGIKGFDAWSLLLEFDWDGYDFMNHSYMTRMVDYYLRTLKRDLDLENSYFVDTLIVKITNKCTLRCENCASFTPYVNAPCDFDFDNTVEDSLLVMDAIGDFRNLSLFGGEPFANKELASYINTFCKMPNFEVIDIITNGTLLPSEDLLDSMKLDSRIYVRISDYGKISRNKDELADMLQANDIKHEVIDYKIWYKRSDIRAFFESDEDLKLKYTSCMNGSHPCISNGKLYLCKVAVTLCDIGIFPKSDTNFLDLKTLKGISKDEQNIKIREYISKMYSDEYMDACRYCSGKVSANALDVLVPPAIQAKGKLTLAPISVQGKS